MYHGIGVSNNFDDTYDIEIFSESLEIILSISEKILRKFMIEIKNVLDE